MSEAKSEGLAEWCHLCDCLRGWPHSDIGLRHGDPAHAPFLETDCQSCWTALAMTEWYVNGGGELRYDDAD